MRRLCRLSRIVAVACICASATAHADAVSELDDAAARMQYAFHTADLRGAEEALNIVGKLELPASMNGMKEYFTAYGRWKLAELHTDEAVAGKRSARGAATKEAAACVRAAEGAEKSDPKLAEAFAIEAICSTMASRAPDVLSLGGCSKHKGLRTAKELAPANPRVLLIEAQCAAELDKPGSTAPLERLRQLVQAFETVPPSRPGLPDWGQAEALLMLGEAYLARGDAAAARDPIERALVIAPDYRKARDALEKSSARAR
jgi:tetratricopeptide (TPR) repeat protein